jgi:hypothetical protein
MLLAFTPASWLQVFPKMLDMFLLVLYGSMVPVVCLQFSWLSDWVSVYHSTAVAAFIGVSDGGSSCSTQATNCQTGTVGRAGNAWLWQAQVVSDPQVVVKLLLRTTAGIGSVLETAVLEKASSAYGVQACCSCRKLA